MAREMEKYWFSGPSGCSGNARAISWQGWLVVAIHVSVVTAAALLLAERTPVGFGAIVIVSTAVLLAICHAKTPGGLSFRLPPGMGGPQPHPKRRRR